MTTTFKYKFYALNETMPSWLSDGDQNFFYHNVERAMVFYSQAGGRSIDTAMDDFAFTNTASVARNPR